MSIAVYSAQQTQQLFDLFSAMTDYYAGDPARINHFVKVHAYARQIGLRSSWTRTLCFCWRPLP